MTEVVDDLFFGKQAVHCQKPGDLFTLPEGSGGKNHQQHQNNGYQYFEEPFHIVPFSGQETGYRAVWQYLRCGEPAGVAAPEGRGRR
jgi:hypothetical protein